MEHDTALQWLSVLAVGTLLVGVCQRFRLSPIIGYLVTGVVVGPAVFGWLHDVDTIRMLSEVGVVLLMFTIGLEFSLSRLLAAKRLVLGLGSAQVLLTATAIGVLAWLLGLAVSEAAIVGIALAMSSTAIVLKQLGEQMELPAPHGRYVMSILLFQDLAAVPVLVVLPVLAANPQALASALGLALVKGGLVLSGLLLAGRYVLPPLLHWIAATRSLELFMLTALLLALSAAGISQMAGLSPTLGAFMAGMLLGETEFRHQIEADIRPFRDLMLGLFFVSIGIQLDPGVFLDSFLAVGMVLVAIVLLKPLVLAPLVRFFGYSLVDGVRTAVCLAQGGEFGLLVVSLAMTLGLLGAAVAQPLLGGVIFSMLLAPLLVRYNQQIAAGLLSGSDVPEPLSVEAQAAALGEGFRNHVVVCGYGRLGQNVVRIVAEEGVATLALDLDPERVRQAAAAGEPVIFGNALQPGVLRAAGLEHAAALAVTIGDAHVAERIIRYARSLGFDRPVIVRSTHGRDDEALVAAGAVVFPEGLEASLAFAGQLMILLDMPPSQVESTLNAIRAEDYAPLRVFFHDSAVGKAREQALDFPREVRAFVIQDHHEAIGKTPWELALERHGVRLANVQRGPIRVPGELLDTRLRAGDVLLLEGTPEALERTLALIEGR